MLLGREGNDAMKGLGFDSGGMGVREKECQQEMGEACLGKEDNGCIDPDVDFYYIDVKLQHVLGDPQREFEGGVSVENLGAKFSDYGSFLPTSPPISSQLRSPPKDTGHTIVSSPNGLSCKGASNNTSIQINAPITKNCLVLNKDLDLGGSVRKDASTTVSTTRNPVEDNDLINKETKGSIQNPLKVRIKVGPNNISDRNNSAIYSDPILDLSPSSSSENSLEGIKDTFEDGVTDVSPQTILQLLHEDLKHSQREVAWERKDEVVLGKMQPLVDKNKINDIKIAKKNLGLRSVDKNSAFASRNEAHMQTCTNALMCDHPGTDAAVAAAPIVIKDHWACCDLCEKWRFLPTAINPDDLPNKWTCNMQVWLPVGMNHCIISEDETTKFMNPQCHASFLESNVIPGHSAPSASSASVHVNQVSCQLDSTNDTNSKHLRWPSDAPMGTQKVNQKAKRKRLQCSSSEVGIRQSKVSKLIGEGLINSDISGPKKTIHPDGYHLLNKDSKISSDLMPKVANSSSVADLTGKQMGEIGDKYLGNSVRELKGGGSSLNGTMKAHVGLHTGGIFKQASRIDSELSGNLLIPVKKRKARECHEIQNNQTSKRSRHLGEKSAMFGEDNISVKKKESKFNLRCEKAEEPSFQPPMRKFVASKAALVVMKEAKELKHAADRIKNSGEELEGIALYFQAALKFLHAASLLEPSRNVDINYDELNELMKTYTETAVLCEFCAREYEKKKNMALAALAYKCMAVAYFKVAFFKSYIVSKDYHELQATFLQDGSPSLSASGLGNLNQLDELEKLTFSKIANSHQNTGSHGTVSKATFSRWLDCTNVSIFAFEASRKSQNALSAASASFENNGCGNIASVEDALNFNFHNIGELLSRIRASMESFN